MTKHSEAPNAAWKENSCAAVSEWWKEVESGWDVPSTHQRFLSRCIAAKALHQAAHYYRGVKERSAEREEVAAQQLRAILSLALHEIDQREPSKAYRAKRPITLVALCISGGLILWSVWLWLHASA